MTSGSSNNKKCPQKCPICGKLAAQETTPFCSKRCADVDLARWFKGGYSTPIIEEDDEPDTSEETTTEQ